MEDFGPVAGMLLIRRSKGGQSRYVPLHVSVVKELNDYKRLRHKHHPQAKSRAFSFRRRAAPFHTERQSTLSIR